MTKGLFIILPLLLCHQLVLSQTDPYPKDSILHTYYSKNWLCSSTLIIHEDGHFYNESGCEGRSAIAYGTWKRVSDTLFLERQNFTDSNFFIIRKVTHESIDSDSSFISIYDMYGENITESQPLKLTTSQTGASYHLDWMNLLSGFGSEEAVKSNVSVSESKYQISELLPARIQLLNLLPELSKKHQILISKSRRTKIYLNLPSKLLSSWEIEEMEGSYEPLKIVVKEDGLFIKNELFMSIK